MRLTLHACLSAAVACVLVCACGTTTQTSPAGSRDAPSPSDEAGSSSSDDDDGSDAVDAGSDVAEAGSDAVPSLTDPKNCGAAGHDCHGAACSNGFCEPEAISSVTTVLAIAVRGNDLVYAEEPIPNEEVRFVRGGVVPGSAFAPITGPWLVATDFHDLHLELGGGFLYYLEDEDPHVLQRRPLDGTNATMDEAIGTPKAARPWVRSFAVDDDHVVFDVAPTVLGQMTAYWRTHSGVAATFSPVNDLSTHSFQDVSVATSFFALDGNHAVYDLGVVPASSSLDGPVAGTLQVDRALAATKNAFYGLRSNSADAQTCQATSYEVWQRARPGGATSVIASGIGQLPELRADDKGALYTVTPCDDGTPGNLMTYRADGTSFSLLAYSAGTRDLVFAQDETWVYFVLDDGSGASLYRVAR